MSENIANQLGLSVPAKITATKCAIALAITGASVARFAPDYIDGAETRGVIPEPFDIVNHAGNLATTMVFVGHISYVAHGKDKWDALTEEEHKRRTKGVGIFCGAITLAANIFAEKIGYGPVSTPDPLDFAYGCLGGYLGYQGTKSRYFNPNIVHSWYVHDAADQGVKKRIYDTFEARGIRIVIKEEEAAGTEPAQVLPTVDKPTKKRTPPVKNSRTTTKKTHRKSQKSARRKNRR